MYVCMAKNRQGTGQAAADRPTSSCMCTTMLLYLASSPLSGSDSSLREGRVG